MKRTIEFLSTMPDASEGEQEVEHKRLPTIQEVATDIGVEQDVIKRKIKKFREPQPNWFQMQKGEGGHPELGLKPELIDLLREEIDPELARYAPDGWLTVYVLRKKILTEHGVDVPESTIKKLATDLGKDMLEPIKKFISKKSRRPVEHCSPELCGAIERSVMRPK